jgi:hypothetical protein
VPLLPAVAIRLLLAISFTGTVKAVAQRVLDRSGGDGSTTVQKVRVVRDDHAITITQEHGDADDADDDDSEDSELQVVPPHVRVEIHRSQNHLPPMAPRAPVPPTPPIPPTPPSPPGADDDESPFFSETAKNVPTADVLHRIARTAGWSLTLVAIPKERIDVDLHEADPKEAVREVLKASGAMGVLRRDRLVVVPSHESPGLLVVERTKNRGPRRAGSSRGRTDYVRVFQGDLTIPQGTVVQGDVVNVGGSIDLEPGSVVQGDAVSVFGSTTVEEGAVVLGDAAAVFGGIDVHSGAQIMGEHVQIGFGKLFSHRKHRTFLSDVGPLGFFPTLALFALIYLLGLLSLRLWPERVRAVAYSLFEQPVKSFVVGFLCWLLFLPVLVLLCISIVGILLVPLLPVVIFLAIVMGLSALALRVGEALPAGPGERFVPPAALGMGMVVLLLLAFVPLLGIPLLALLQFFALGAAVGSRFGRALPAHR